MPGLSIDEQGSPSFLTWGYLGFTVVSTISAVL